MYTKGRIIRIADNRLRRWSFFGKSTGAKAETQKTHANSLNFASMFSSKNAYRTTTEKRANISPPILKRSGSL
jgi:hypothetical protein